MGGGYSFFCSLLVGHDLGIGTWHLTMARRLVSYSDLVDEADASSDAHGVVGGSKRKRGQAVGGLKHWDDPSSSLDGAKDDGADGVDAIQEGLDEGTGEGYVWKYDEWGRLAGDTTTPVEQDYDFDVPFSIPSPPLAYSDFKVQEEMEEITHRPPVEVGGGGRTLLHSEIWSASAIVDAFKAAHHQYLAHHIPTNTNAAPASALWTQAPHHKSLLAQQVKADTLQILAQNKPSSKSNQSSTTSHQSTATHVPAADMDGNTAWKKAVKTVQATPNSIGSSEWNAGYSAGYNDALNHLPPQI